GSQAERADHHRGQGVCEFAFEHRAFTSDDAMIVAPFAEQERWKNIGQVDLARAREIAAAAIEVLSHHAEVAVAGAEDVAHLPQHFLDTNVGAGVARAVVSSEEQPQLFPGLPAAAESKHPADAPNFNQRADPRHEEKIAHARALPPTVSAHAAVETARLAS